jgi:2-polyprenyl-3-methyl-5-hydroxy-6-metoxy-1,4-benzoquinol methylase
VLRKLQHAVLRAARRYSADGTQVISTLDALDRKLAECDAAAMISDDALRRVFGSFRMEVPLVDSDPFSLQYSNFQMDLYRRISGKAYSPQNEVSNVDPTSGAVRPFPFCTGSPSTAGNHSIALGFLLRTLKAGAGARILEFGAGWGNTTIALASLGYRVTAIDIEPRFCELIRKRALTAGVDIDVQNEDFFYAENVREQFDIAVFHECFHHCSDHIRLLKALRTAVKLDGRVYFSCEPINMTFPVPWGIRMDGESLWAIRRNGWLELGFHTEYFHDALTATGWVADVYSSRDIGWITVWEAHRAQ